MQRVSSSIVHFDAEEVAAMVRERLKAEGVQPEMLMMQIVVSQPFGDGLKVHSEVPGLTVVLANAGM